MRFCGFIVTHRGRFCKRSAEEGGHVRGGEGGLERQRDGGAEERAHVADAAVDVLGRDEQPGWGGVLIAAEGGTVDDRGDAHGDHREAERPGVDRLAVVAHAAAGGQSRVGELDGGAETVAAARRQGVDDDDDGGADVRRRAADQLQRLHAGGGENAGAKGRYRTEPGELAGHRLKQMAGDEKVLQRGGAHGVGGHGTVAQPHHQRGALAGREEGAKLTGETGGGAGQEGLLPGEEGAEIHGDVGAGGSAQEGGTGFGGDADAGDGTAAVEAFRSGDAGAGGKNIAGGGQLLGGLHRQICAGKGHNSG